MKAYPQDSIAWNVSKRMPWFADESVTGAEKYRGIVRDDTGALLAIRTKEYEVLQNAELLSLAEIAANESGGRIAGTIVAREGRKVGVIVENGTYQVPGDPSEFRGTYAFWNTHDGSSPFSASEMIKRDRCWNLFPLNLSGIKTELLQRFNLANDRLKATSLIRIRHSASMPEKIKGVREYLGSAAGEFRAFVEYAEALHQSFADWDRFKSALFPEQEEMTEALEKEIAESRALLDTVRARSTNDGIRDSAWGFANVAVEAFDHDIGVKRRTKRSEENLLLRSLGVTNQKDRIFSALQLAMR